MAAAFLKKTVYLDLDGVMADYDKHFANLFPSYDLETLDKATMWKLVHSVDNFFSTIPFCEGAEEAWGSWIHQHNPVILTAAGSSNYEHVAKQKREWVRYHLGRGVQVIAVRAGLEKPLMMREDRDILIDDWEKNTSAWFAAGGLPILHAGDWSTTLSIFKDTIHLV